jgi:hypothetical protein
MSEPSPSSITIYQFRVVLWGVSPLVWRRLLLASDTSIAELHEILKSAFDWSGEHLHASLSTDQPAPGFPPNPSMAFCEFGRHRDFSHRVGRKIAGMASRQCIR